MSKELAGALLPVWLLGAPLLGAVLEYLRTPKPSATTSAFDRSGRPGV